MSVIPLEGPNSKHSLTSRRVTVLTKHLKELCPMKCKVTHIPQQEVHDTHKQDSQSNMQIMPRTPPRLAS